MNKFFQRGLLSRKFVRHYWKKKTFATSPALRQHTFGLLQPCCTAAANVFSLSIGWKFSNHFQRAKGGLQSVSNCVRIILQTAKPPIMPKPSGFCAHGGRTALNGVSNYMNSWDRCNNLLIWSWWTHDKKTISLYFVHILSAMNPLCPSRDNRKSWSRLSLRFETSFSTRCACTDVVPNLFEAAALFEDKYPITSRKLLIQPSDRYSWQTNPKVTSVIHHR